MTKTNKISIRFFDDREVQVVSVTNTNHLKLTAPDGKKRLTDALDNTGVLSLAACFPNTKAARFVEHFYTSLADKINDRETFMKGIDYSYYYEQED